MTQVGLRLRVERAVARTVLRLPAPLLRRIAGAPRRSPEGYELDVQGQALLTLLRVTGEPEMHEGSIRRARRALDHAGAVLEPTAHDVTTTDLTVPGAVGPLRARRYEPASARGRTTPGLVFFHGGGFTLGSIRSHDGICRAFASRAGAVVVSVEYRLAPEDPYPAAPNDAISATRWILEHGATLGIDTGAVAVGGDSAGGNLSAVVAQALRRDARRPVFQLLIYPATDMTKSEASHRIFREGVILPEPTVEFFRNSYVPVRATRTEPLASPLLAEDLGGLPPALVLTAGFDPLRDEGRRYADRMKAAGVEVEYVISEGSMHGFMNMAGAVDESRRIFELAADRLRRALARAQVASAA
jgi:acetyl esterase